MIKNRLRICDLTLRDGHQSLFATRMRTSDMEPVAPEMNRVGFDSMEIWGGATFDVATRFLNEDPWDRPRILKKLMPDTPLQMLLRGQNLVGYRNYADDVVTAFVRHSAEVGIDVFRVFDAVNDERNFETCLAAIKECSKHAQLAISYSLTEPRLGGPVYNIDYFVKKATILQKMGADSVCIKDMAGLMAPEDASDLIKALKKVIKVPICLHSHYTSGMGSMTLLKAVEAGVDIVDTTLAPFALRSSHPAVEPLVVALQGTPRDTGLDLHHLFKLGEYFEKIAPKYRDFMDSTRTAVIDTGVLEHQIPGGMISNLVSQLREAGALDRINEVYEELPRVRKELGYPPLVTPTSQIVGIQAVQNVLFGRYKMISSQVKDYVYGLYGKPPVPVDPDVQKIVLKGYERGETPITSRAADAIEPEMEKAREATKGLAKDAGDVLTYALYPTTGLAFLKAKYGQAPPPPGTEKLKTMEDIKREDEMIAKVKAGKISELISGEKKAGIRAFKVYMEDQVYSVGVEEVDGYQVPTSVANVTPTAIRPTPAQAKANPRELVTGDEQITAPMPGVIIRCDVKVGDDVKAGDSVVILEAMKMDNTIPAPTSGRVKALYFKAGDHVNRNDLLAVIGA
ncbi:MAG: carboxylase [Dehalococcoidia bacterium]|jgi:pyruvate carboxylase subunit B|nr:MAG: carboxylase [Dehalococcoidia bacterium]